jgi:hypothetical protein
MKIKTIVLTASVATLVASGASAQAAAPRAAADALIDRLVGNWRMTGKVRGTPVEYRLAAARTLAGKYVELHMIDTAKAPQYEARVFVGADTVPGGILVHWIDTYGAAYSVPPGVGAASGDTLRFQIAYPDGVFRDTFVYRPPTHSWYFRIESSDHNGGWKLFAEYDVHAPSTKTH